MFDWLFPPTCPCDSAAKAWIEQRLQWLADKFEDSAFSGRRIVLPTPEFFPDPYDGSNKTVRLLLDRVCEYMDVDPYNVSLEFKADAGKLWLVDDLGKSLPSGAAGTYQPLPSPSFSDTLFDPDNPFDTSQHEQRSLIRIDKSGFHNPMNLVGTMAHELAHARLLGEYRVGRKAFDNELLTDLTVVHFGLGIFLANSPRNWESQYTKWPKTDLLKPEYMTSPMFGWALAHLAWFRGEHKLAWAKYLNSGARANFKQGLRYLEATGDSSYQPARLQGERHRA